MLCPKSNFRIVSIDPKSLVIEDIGPWDTYKSVTNDAETVVAYLFERGWLQNDHRLYYYDSSGTPGEILIEAGKFKGFKYVAKEDMP